MLGAGRVKLKMTLNSSALTTGDGLSRTVMGTEFLCQIQNNE